jgi:hypothetical protein
MNQIVAQRGEVPAQRADGGCIRVRLQAANPRLAGFKQSGHVPLGQARVCPQASQGCLLGHRKDSFHRLERGDVPEMRAGLAVEDELGCSDTADIEFVCNVTDDRFHPSLGRILVSVQDEKEV